MTPAWRSLLPWPRSVFAQLSLVIALVLLGAGLLAVVLGREMVLRPGAQQLVRAMDGFANIAEALEHEESAARLESLLRQAGLKVSRTPPDTRPRMLAPLAQELARSSAHELAPTRKAVIGRGPDGPELWLRLHTHQPMWVSFPGNRARNVRHLSVLLLLGCTLLVWLAAAYFARRLVQPLRQLAHDAPAVTRGEPPRAIAGGSPREVDDLALALERAAHDVRDAGAERSVMLAGISHDLRTPLTRLQYALALIPEVEPALRDGMERDIADIDAILTQFIAYARDGRDEQIELLDLADLCRSIVSAASLSWSVSLPATAPMRGRPLALARAIDNLVGNAERHGKPPFALTLEPVDSSWQLAVIDHGPGLSPERAERALQPFVHDPAGGGSGLGLPIVQRIARQHGGDLHLLANPPQGLHAQLRLARAPAEKRVA